MALRPAPAPHLPVRPTVTGVMFDVVLALIPATLVYVFFFGPGLLVNMAIASATALGAEAAMLRARQRPVMPALRDLSALVTALLLAFSLPPLVPWWVTVTATLFAIVFAKHLYGGLGFNPFNPAMAGYVVALVAFPTEMTLWLPPRVDDIAMVHPSVFETLRIIVTGSPPPGQAWDTITMATPLDQVKSGLQAMSTMSEIKSTPMYGSMGGRGWEWVSNALFLGGFWLLHRGVVRWHTPVGVLAGLLSLATLFYLAGPDTHSSPAFHLFSGATVLGAFFIATDPVSSATSPKGRLIYGFGIGAVTYVIRTWGAHPDGLAFAVLLMNMCVPAIDHFTRPRVYGHER